MNKNISLAVVTAFVVGIAGFLGGMYYQKSQPSTQLQYVQTGGQGRFGARGGRFGQATVGQIVSLDSNSITVKLQDGSTKIINLTKSTRIVKTQTAGTTDLSNGTTVAVFGATNSDGSVTAQNVQINPMRMQQGSPTPSQ